MAMSIDRKLYILCLCKKYLLFPDLNNIDEILQQAHINVQKGYKIKMKLMAKKSNIKEQQ